MKVRKLVESDWEQYRNLRLLSLSQSPQSFENSVEDESSLTDEQWISRVTPTDEAFILAAFEGSTIVGVSGFARGRKEKTRHKSFLWGVFVNLDCRSHGIATELLDTLLREVSGMKGLSRVLLNVAADNTGAISLYKKAGFSTYGTEADAIRVAGKSYDEVLMAYVVNET